MYLYQGGDDGNEGQHNSDHQLDEDEGLDEDLLLGEDHLHVGHGHVREGLDHNVALRHALCASSHAGFQCEDKSAEAIY